MISPDQQDRPASPRQDRAVLMLVHRRVSDNRPTEKGFENRNLSFDQHYLLLVYTRKMGVLPTA